MLVLQQLSMVWMMILRGLRLVLETKSLQGQNYAMKGKLDRVGQFPLSGLLIDVTFLQ
jgi:hypothetical protein